MDDFLFIHNSSFSIHNCGFAALSLSIFFLSLPAAPYNKNKISLIYLKYYYILYTLYLLPIVFLLIDRDSSL